MADGRELPFHRSYFHIQPAKQKNVGDKQQRNAQWEESLFGLVTKQPHTQKTSQAAADSGNCPDDFFRGSAISVDSIMLIYKHNQEAGHIDYNEVQS